MTSSVPCVDANLTDITTDALDNIEVNSKNNVQWSDCAEEIDIGGEYIIESINETPNGGTLQAIENQAAVLARELQSDSDESDPDYPDYTPTSDFEFNEESRHDRTDLNLNKPNITNAEAEFTNIGAQRSLTKHVETKKQQQNRRKGRPYLGYKINSSSSKKKSYDNASTYRPRRKYEMRSLIIENATGTIMHLRKKDRLPLSVINYGSPQSFCPNSDSNNGSSSVPKESSNYSVQSGNMGKDVLKYYAKKKVTKYGVHDVVDSTREPPHSRTNSQIYGRL
ncbi:hypothetical protein V9T40_000804 [Parthenolecanium corni]|uniref:Uncharacterized protein n=1 Tax=Parthenolecanium corni TaxID=536013 RepID=A0AAN9TCB0_9HEMI